MNVYCQITLFNIIVIHTIMKVIIRNTLNTEILNTRSMKHYIVFGDKYFIASRIVSINKIILNTSS